MRHSENYFPLLTSPIWDQQKKYYQKKGANAWDFVPFLYTSNKFMAYWVANIISNLAKSHPQEKIQILELGSGHAMFSYFLYKRLNALGVEFTMVVSDLIQSNLDYLQALPQWQGLNVTWLAIEKITDMQAVANFDGVSFVIANYFFDSLANAGFCQVDGQWEGAYLATQKKKNKVEGVVDFDLSFISKPCEISSEHQVLLDRYKDDVEYVLIPEEIKQIIKLFDTSNKPTYFIANDKGYMQQEKMNYANNYAYNCDGAMATMVNFDAVRYWVEQEFNGFMVANGSESDDTHFVVFSINNKDQECKRMVNMALSGVAWNTVFKLFMFFEQQPELSFEDAYFYVEASKYDEAMLSRISGFIINQVKEHGDLVHQLKPLLHKVLQDYYWHPARVGYYYTLIDLLVLCNEYDVALKLIDQYRYLVPSQYDVLLREGIIFYKTKNNENAKDKFEKILKINPKCQEANRYMALMD